VSYRKTAHSVYNLKYHLVRITTALPLDDQPDPAFGAAAKDYQAAAHHRQIL
jgi:hypothetical protein